MPTSGTHRRKILLVTRPAIGGAARHVQLICDHLDQTRFELTVVVSPLEDPAYLDRLREAGVEVLSMPMRRELHFLSDFVCAKRLYQCVAEGSFDVVHAHTTKPGAMMRIIARQRGVPRVIYTPHGFYFTYDLSPRKQWFYRKLEKTLARMTDRFVCLSAAEAALADELVPGRSVLIPNAVEQVVPASDLERAAVRAEYGLPEDCRLLVLVGRLDEPKEPEIALAAMDRLRSTHGDVALLVIGSGQLEEELRAEKISRDLGESVVIAGEVAGAASILAAADLALLCSKSEGMPYVLLEAGAAGVPVVATDLPGTRLVVQHDETGLLVPASDPVALAAAITAILDDDDRRASMGARARQRVSERFALKDWITAIEELYS